MMSNAVKNIIVRVVQDKLVKGGKFEEIIKNYPRLTQKEIEEIKKEL